MSHHPTLNQSLIVTQAATKIGLMLHKEHCHRCGGLMIRDHCLDVQSDSGEVEVKVLRCCACGELIDPIILMNRLKSQNLGPDQVLAIQHKHEITQKPVHQDGLAREILETWAAARRRDEFQGHSESH